MTTGFVSLVGAGPRHPDYLTVKGARVLAQAEVIVYDALISDEFHTHFPADAEVPFVGKCCGKHSSSQEQICALLVNGARRGKRVVRLKGGDSGLFSRAGEEILALRVAGISFEIIPGVSSVFAGAAAALFSPTHRGLSNRLVVFDGHALRHDDFDFRPLLAHQGTTVVLMGSRQIERLAAGLICAGASPQLPIALVENATLADQHVAVTTLDRAAAGELLPRSEGPGIIYVGAAVALAQASRRETVEAAA
ncbi:MAG TPA: uroporphyrinogen-III C-methyltransferase [Polyangia bacterium]|nr:uroporphyrinogen-III C-methyltransferase [Polyangia bacterium]